MLFVQRVFPVAVGRLAQRFAGIAPDTMGRPHLAADVPGVHLVHHISKWGKLIFAVIAVYAVIHRNEKDIVFREEGVCVVSNTEIISAKPGHIFHDDAVGASRLYVLQHFLKARTLEIGACEAVVDPDGVFPKLRAGADKVPQQLPLPGDAVGFLFIAVVPRQSEVKRGVPNFCFLVVLHIASSFTPKLYLQCA